MSEQTKKVETVEEVYQIKISDLKIMLEFINTPIHYINKLEELIIALPKAQHDPTFISQVVETIKANYKITHVDFTEQDTDIEVSTDEIVNQIIKEIK